MRTPVELSHFQLKLVPDTSKYSCPWDYGLGAFIRAMPSLKRGWLSFSRFHVVMCVAHACVYKSCFGFCFAFDVWDLVCVHARGDPKLEQRFILHHSPSVFTEKSNPELTDTVLSLASLLSVSTFRCWNYRQVASPTRHLHGCLGSELWSLCLHSKCFNHWAISQFQAVFFFFPKVYMWDDKVETWPAKRSEY